MNGFNTFYFMKTKVHNQLNTHLDLCVRMFGYNFFTLKTFTYDEPIVIWEKKNHVQ
jgi:hypothetical protein